MVFITQCMQPCNKAAHSSLACMRRELFSVGGLPLGPYRWRHVQQRCPGVCSWVMDEQAFPCVEMMECIQGVRYCRIGTRITEVFLCGVAAILLAAGVMPFWCARELLEVHLRLRAMINVSNRLKILQRSECSDSEVAVWNSRCMGVYLF